LFGKAGAAIRTLDRRPKVVEVMGFDAEEQEEITSHLNVRFIVDYSYK
jgi:hypothetical protein